MSKRELLAASSSDRTQSRVPMARVTTTLLADRQLQQVPGLRAKLDPILDGILDTAIETKKLHGALVSLDPPIAVHVDGHTVWYALDLDRGVASILVVEPDDRGTEGPPDLGPIKNSTRSRRHEN